MVSMIYCGPWPTLGRMMTSKHSQNYMKKKPRRQYCLVVAFQEASMIEKTDDQIKFQISMGNYATSFTSDLELFLSTNRKKGV